MINIQYEGLEDLRDLMARLSDNGLKRALRNATNDTAFATMTVGRYRMKQVFDMPVAWTINAWYVRKKASYDNMTAQVGMTDYQNTGTDKGPDRVLHHQFIGGERSRKGMEMHLVNAGKMSGTERLVLASGAKKTAAGNINAGQVAKIMSQLKMGDAASWSTTSQGGSEGFFWSNGTLLPRGIWQRKQGGVQPILLVVANATYQKRMDLDDLKQEMFEDYFKPIFIAQLDYQLTHS